ncbi:MAG: restriction endonuclease [Terracidiphilus sp.]
MPIPDFQTVMLPLLRLAAEKEWRISDAVEHLSNGYDLSEEEREAVLPSGRQTIFRNRVAWAKSYLIKAGLLNPTKRGYFCITDQGRTVLSNPPDRITIKFLSQFPEFELFRKTNEQTNESEEHLTNLTHDSSLTPDETIRNAHALLEQELADELLVRIRSGSPAFFESLVVRLLIAMGYGGATSETEIKKSLVGGTGDGGVDGVIDQDILGLDRIYVQAKRYADGNNVGASAIREFFGSLDRFKASKGLFVTASTYTDSARKEASQLSKRLVLVDGGQLTRLMIRHNVGCRVEETLEIKKIDEEFFE